MKIIFFMFPFAGHIIPNISLVKEILSRGGQIIVYGSKNYIFDLNLCGEISFEFYPNDIMEFCSISNTVDLKNASDLYYSNLYDENSMQTREYKIQQFSRKFCEDNIDKIRDLDADLVLYDTYAFFVKDLINNLGIKGIEINCSTWEVEDISRSESWKEYLTSIVAIEAKKSPSVQEIIMTHRKMKRFLYKQSMKQMAVVNDRISYAYHNKELQDEVDLVLSSRQYMGFDLPVKHNLVKDGSIYVSRGTMSDAYGVLLLHETMKCLINIKSQVIVTLANNKIADNLISHQSWPGNFNVMAYVNQQEILASASIFVTHGGITGVREALINNTPMVIIPANFLDFQVGKSIEEANAGLMIKERPLSSKDIESKISEIMDNYDVYLDGVNRLCSKMRKQWCDCGLDLIMSDIGI